MKPNFGATAGDYACHRAGFPDSLFDRLSRFGIGVSGQRIVDLGTGTGSLARGFALRGCRAIGIDSALPMLEAARRLDAEVRAQVEYRIAKAEDTGLPEDPAHVVSVGQCWHGLDRPRAAREAARLLRGGARLLIAHFILHRTFAVLAKPPECAA